jgi:hypothetical protein
MRGTVNRWLGTLCNINVVDACGYSFTISTAAIPECTTHYWTEAGYNVIVAVGDGDKRIIHQPGNLDRACEIRLNRIGEGIDIVEVDCSGIALGYIFSKAIVGVDLHAIMHGVAFDAVNVVAENITVFGRIVIKQFTAVGRYKVETVVSGNPLVVIAVNADVIN